MKRRCFRLLCRVVLEQQLCALRPRRKRPFPLAAPKIPGSSGSKLSHGGAKYGFSALRHKRPIANFRAQALTAATRELIARRSDKLDRTAVNAEYIPRVEKRAPNPRAVAIARAFHVWIAGADRRSHRWAVPLPSPIRRDGSPPRGSRRPRSSTRSRRPAVRPLVTAATMPKASASRASSNRMETAPNSRQRESSRVAHTRL
jgi:hypothetical protein